MALSHYKNSEAATRKYEVVNPSLFEVTFMLPEAIEPSSGGNNNNLLLEHVHSISGLDGVNPSIGTSVQKFKFAERHFAGGPEQTHLELTINFSLNLNTQHENYIYTTMRKWCNLIYNPATGSCGTKSTYCGKMIIVEYDRDGSIWRMITCDPVFPTGQMTGMGERSYDSVNEANELSITFMCDCWEEKTVGLPIYNYESTN